MKNIRFSLSEDFISKILNPEIKKIFVLGGPDTGKTTLIECLLEILVGNCSIGVIDCDMGQSHIGPPVTIGWAKVKDQFNSWDELRLEDFYFVGSLSPSGNTQRTLEGIRFIFHKANQITDKIILDTTGYISGYEAIDFKIREIGIIQPDLIIALQRKDELENILTNFRDRLIYRIDPPLEVRSKTLSERANYRDRCFRRYFSQSKELLFPGEIFRRLDEKDTDILDKIVSLQNNEGKDLALGLVLEKKDKDILVLSPQDDPGDVFSVIVGLCKWQRV